MICPKGIHSGRVELVENGFFCWECKIFFRRYQLTDERLEHLRRYGHWDGTEHQRHVMELITEIDRLREPSKRIREMLKDGPHNVHTITPEQAKKILLELCFHHPKLIMEDELGPPDNAEVACFIYEALVGCEEMQVAASEGWYDQQMDEF